MRIAELIAGCTPYSQVHHLSTVSCETIYNLV